MAKNPAKRREIDWPWRGDTNVTLSSHSSALRSGEPRLGRTFIEGERNGKQDDEHFTVGQYLLGKLGSRGYGRMLQRANERTTADTRVDRRPPRRRRRSRKVVAA